MSGGGSGGGERGRAGAAVLISSSSPSAQARMPSPAAALGVSKSSNAIHTWKSACSADHVPIVNNSLHCKRATERVTPVSQHHVVVHLSPPHVFQRHDDVVWALGGNAVAGDSVV